MAGASNIPDRVMPFSLELLAAARANALPLDSCAGGHMVVNGNTHYRPTRFADGFRTLVCELVETCDAAS